MYSAWLCHGIEINITCIWWFSLHCSLVSDIDCMCLGIQINIKYVNVSDDLVCIVALFQTLTVLEQEDDINQITDFFSYEHFYVIYCKFWELDKDHDLFISKEDLARHNDHGIYPLWRLISYRNRVRGDVPVNQSIITCT